MWNSHGWRPERREKARAAIHRWKPWQSSTGPRTPEGKARVAQNANQGAAACRAFYRELLEAGHAYLTGYGSFRMAASGVMRRSRAQRRLRFDLEQPRFEPFHERLGSARCAAADARGGA